jgi:hypothetical protein
MYARCSSARSATPESSEPMRARTRSAGRASPPEPRRKYSRRAARTISEVLRPDLRLVRSSAVASSGGRRTVSCDSIVQCIVMHLHFISQTKPTARAQTCASSTTSSSAALPSTVWPLPGVYSASFESPKARHSRHECAVSRGALSVIPARLGGQSANLPVQISPVEPAPPRHSRLIRGACASCMSTYGARAFGRLAICGKAVRSRSSKVASGRDSRSASSTKSVS